MPWAWGTPDWPAPIPSLAPQRRFSGRPFTVGWRAPAFSCADVGSLMPKRSLAPGSLGGPTLSGVGDEEFADYIASRLAGLRGVAA